MGLIGARERRVIPAKPELEEKENEREAAKETRVLSRRISYKPRRGSERERAMVRTVVAAYLDVLCVLNLLSSDASIILCGADQDTCHVPLPSLLEEISPSPLLLPISLPAVHISPVGDCRRLSDRGCRLLVCTSLRRESERKRG